MKNVRERLVYLTREESPSESFEGIKGLMREISELRREIRKEATNNKTSTGPYPIQKGYAEAVRRPVVALTKWMRKTELVLSIVVNELEILRQDIE